MLGCRQIFLAKKGAASKRLKNTALVSVKFGIDLGLTFKLGQARFKYLGLGLVEKGLNTALERM